MKRSRSGKEKGGGGGGGKITNYFTQCFTAETDGESAATASRGESQSCGEEAGSAAAAAALSSVETGSIELERPQRGRTVRRTSSSDSSDPDDDFATSSTSHHARKISAANPAPASRSPSVSECSRTVSERASEASFTSALEDLDTDTNVESLLDSVADESKILSQFVPPPKFKFPKDSSGRSCQSSWFTKMTWVHYDEAKDRVFCFPCMQARRLGKAATVRGNEETFVTVGYQKWKKALEKLTAHGACQQHNDSVQFVINALAKESVANRLNAQLKEEQKKARTALQKIVSSIRYLARSGLALRGHDNDSGNLMTLLEERALSCPELAAWLKRRDKWLSGDVQNEIVEIMAHMVQRKLIDRIKQSPFFALMADGTTDVSGEEQFCIAVRIVEPETLESKELFMGLYNCPDGTSATLHCTCTDVLTRCTLSKDNMRGHTFDGAAAMSGHLNGLQKLLTDDQPKSPFVHCCNHALDLAVQEVCKKCELLSNSLSLVKDVSKAILESSKRKAIYANVVIEPEAENTHTKRLLALCPTRWCIRAKAMRRFVENYARVKETLKLILDDPSCKITDERRATLRGYLGKMEKFDTLLALKIALSVCEPAEQLAKALQSKSYTATGAVQAAKDLWRTYDSMGAADYDRIWAEVETMDSKYELELKMPEQPRTRAPPMRLGQLGGNAAPANLTPKDEIRRKFVSVLDWVKNELNRRFDQPGMKQLANLESLLLDRSVDCVSTEALEAKLGVHSTDFDVPSLAAQLRISRTVIPSSVKTVKEYAGFLKDLPHVSRHMLDQVERLVILLITVPATSCTCERSFSALKYLKNYLRSTMTQRRLTRLLLLFIHSDLCFHIDLDDVVTEFVRRTPERRKTFGN